MAASHDAHAALATEAAGLVGWPADAAPSVTLMPGGATGHTFKLSRGTDDVAHVVRRLDAKTSAGFVRAAKALADAGVTPGVVAASDTLLVTELAPGKPVATPLLDDAASGAAARVAALVAALHGVTPDAAGHAGPSRDDEVAWWLAKAEASMPTMGADLRAAMRAEAARGHAGKVSGPCARSVTTHGDLHPGNILVGEGKAEEGAAGAWLVDLEHVAPRCAGTDIAYLFAVWGDMRYHAGWTPSAAAPIPYAPLDARRAFATAYLQASVAVGGGAGAPSAADVDAFLYQVEVFGLRERFRLMCVWILLCGGDTSHMMAGAAGMYLPHLQHARAAAAKAEAGDADVKASIATHGLVVVGALASAAAAAEAASAAASS